MEMRKTSMKDIFENQRMEDNSTIVLDNCYQTCTTGNGNGWGADCYATFKKSQVTEIILGDTAVSGYDSRLFIVKRGTGFSLWRKKK